MLSPDDVQHAANQQTADLLKMVLIAIGAGIVGVGSFLAWLARIVVPRMFVQGDKTTAALEKIAASGQALPVILENERLKTVVAVGELVRGEAAGIKGVTEASTEKILDELKTIDGHTDRRFASVARALGEQNRELVRLGVEAELLPSLESLTPPAEEEPSSGAQGRRGEAHRSRH